MGNMLTRFKFCMSTNQNFNYIIGELILYSGYIKSETDGFLL
jgi:hypothetical protein